MSTSYSSTDSLPKDSGGQKHMAWVDDGTSQLDFAWPRGIGSESLGGPSQILAHLAVGTHTIGSALGANVGVVIMAAYDESPSAIGQGNAQMLRSDKEGALYTRPASGILAYSSASVQTHVAGSALLHDLHITFNDVDAGDSVRIDDGTAFRLSFIATAASQHFSEHYSTGLVFNTSLKHTITFAGAGAASVSLGYSAY